MPSCQKRRNLSTLYKTVFNPPFQEFAMSVFPRRQLLASALLGLLSVVSVLPAAAQNYPVRPITLIVPWGAGGGTDATARIIGSLLEKELGQPVTVVNRTGGSGVVGHAAIASAQPDGYTIGLATVEIGMMHWQGLTELTSASYTPIGLVNADPAGVQVRADSPYKTVNELLAAIKANPGKFKASGTGQGGIWHLAIAGLLRDQKIDPAALPWVPSNGAAPGLQDMVAGGIEVAPVSLPEARSLIDAGKVKSLAIMNDKPSALYPNVPTLKAALGSDWTMAAWRGIVAPKGLPAPIRDKLAESVRKVAASKEYNEFMASRGFGVIYAGPDDFAKFMVKSNSELGATMKAVGLVK
jgi:tripartite-type tricarboxylate transporter receptor subunit TctC